MRAWSKQKGKRDPTGRKRDPTGRKSDNEIGEKVNFVGEKKYIVTSDSVLAPPKCPPSWPSWHSRSICERSPPPAGMQSRSDAPCPRRYRSQQHNRIVPPSANGLDRRWACRGGRPACQVQLQHLREGWARRACRPPAQQPEFGRRQARGRDRLWESEQMVPVSSRSPTTAPSPPA